MLIDLKDALTRDPANLARDFAGGMALALVLVAGLMLPGLI